jgi:hypothetical protein
MSNDAQKLADAADEKLCLSNVILSNAYYYQSLPFCIIDSIFSVGVRYGQVEKVICHFSKFTNWQPFRKHGSDFPEVGEQKTTDGFLAKYNAVKIPKIDLFNNSCYANPSASSPILKADLVGLFADALAKAKIQTFQDFAKVHDPDKLDQTLRELPSLRSGVVVRYFRMLAGDEKQVKPDRMIRGFINDAIGKELDPDKAAELVQDSCELLKMKYKNLTPRLLDHAIWKFQRN